MAIKPTSLLLDIYDTFDTTPLNGQYVSVSEFREFLTALSLRINLMSRIINQKETGIYSPTGIINSRRVYYDSLGNSAQSVSVLVNVGPLGNGPGNPSTAAHNIDFNSNVVIVSITGSATNTSDPDPANNFAIPIPYVDVTSTAVTGDIELYMDATNIVVTPSGDASDYNKCEVIIEYINIT